MEATASNKINAEPSPRLCCHPQDPTIFRRLMIPFRAKGTTPSITSETRFARYGDTVQWRTTRARPGVRNCPTHNERDGHIWHGGRPEGSACITRYVRMAQFHPSQSMRHIAAAPVAGLAHESQGVPGHFYG